MNPIFFGSSERPLFGVYHPPRTQQPRQQGVVLCYPVGQEYMRAHRAFRQLAILLSREGFPVLRFDYFGTGDSGGGTDAASLRRWSGDIEAAMSELRDNAAVESVSLVGLRIGAWLAADTQTRCADIDRVVLWDPVIDGKAYMRDLLAGTRMPAAERDAVLNDTTNVIGINGFGWSPPLRRDVQHLTAASYTPSSGRIGLLVSEARADYIDLSNRYSSMGRRLTYRCIPGPGDWAYIDAYGSALLPQDIIQAIVGYLTEENGS